MANDTQTQLEDAMYQKVMLRIQEEQERKRVAINTSAFQYGGTITSLEMSTPQPKIDKVTKEVIFANGQPTFWDAIYFCEVAHLGSSRKFVVSLDMGKDLTIGADYLFEGALSDVENKLKVKVITKL